MMLRFIPSLAESRVLAVLVSTLACTPICAQTGKVKTKVVEQKTPSALKILVFVRKMIQLNVLPETSFSAEQANNLKIGRAHV